MRVAALYDIHGNLPALEAVLEDVRRAEVERILIGGDMLPGPMPEAALHRLLELDLPLSFVRGNGDLAVLAQIEAVRTGVVTYWGTTSGNPLPPPDLENMQWCAERMAPDLAARIAAWPRTQVLEIEGLGRVLFCHATPRSEVEIFTRRTAEEKLRPLVDVLEAEVMVCGHTHMPFDRVVSGKRIVNPGSVGMPIGTTGACWATLGPDLQLRRTAYDLDRAAERIRATGYPQAASYADALLHPQPEVETLELYSKHELNG
jgi:predicted phosphodiesterase